MQRNVEGTKSYRATTAHVLAYERASRPKAAKLATNLVLRAKVEKDLKRKYSPEQITGRLRVEFPDDPEMQVLPETIYQSLYVQSRGALRGNQGCVHRVVRGQAVLKRVDDPALRSGGAVEEIGRRAVRFALAGRDLWMDAALSEVT
jgi:IS30 family transposase